MIDEKLLSDLLNAKQETPPPCDQELMTEGVSVLSFYGPRPWVIDIFVKAASLRAGAPIDWHFDGGNSNVVAFSEDLEKAKQALSDLMPTLEEAAKRIVRNKKVEFVGYEVGDVKWM